MIVASIRTKLLAQYQKFQPFWVFREVDIGGPCVFIGRRTISINLSDSRANIKGYAGQCR